MRWRADTTDDETIIVSELIPEEDLPFAGDCPCGRRAIQRITLRTGPVFYMCDDCANKTIVSELKKYYSH